MPKAVLRIADENKRALPRKIRFTIPVLQAVNPPAGKDRLWIYDDRTPGLAFMVTATGARSFYLIYRPKNQHKPERYRIGAFPPVTIEQARTKAAELLGDVAKGQNPHADRRAVSATITLKELFERYKADRTELKGTNQTRVTDESRYNTCLADWSTRKIGTITGAEVRSKHANIGRTRGKVTANRAVQMLRRMFSFARVNPNPAGSGEVDFFPEVERDRFLQPEETARFFAAVNDEPNEVVRDYILVSLYTGARRSNVQAMRWADISFERSTWKIPAGQSKNKEAMSVHVPDIVKDILKRRVVASEFVFPGRGKTGHLVEPKATWSRVLTTAKIVDFHLHDLRRTLGSWMVAAGASLPLIGKQLGHRDQNTTKIYARLNIDPTRSFVDIAAAALATAGKAEK